MEGFFNFSTLMLNEGDPNREALVISAVLGEQQKKWDKEEKIEKVEEESQNEMVIQEDRIPHRVAEVGDDKKEEVSASDSQGFNQEG